jgi:hypothetical protein
MSEGAALDTDELAADAREAFVFAYPLLLMDATRGQMTATPRPTAMAAPVNQFANLPEAPDASFRSVVSPNADTLYSSAWLDLTDEPIVLSVPDTDGRYYLLPLLDAWTNVFASPGARTTGTHSGDFAIVGPDWRGELPRGMREIDAPTSMVWIIGRTQANGRSDYEAVHEVQSGYRLTPVGAWPRGREYTPPPGRPDPAAGATAPVDQVAAMDAEAFFGRAARLLMANPPRRADAEAMARMRHIGVAPGSFAWDSLQDGARRAISAGMAEGLAAIEAEGRKPRAEIRNHWALIYDLGQYGTDYMRRAVVAWLGLGANLPSDALYPITRVDSDGKPLNGSSSYVLHFEVGETPPVHAFWSLTMYDDRQFFVDNPLDRYAIGDRDPLEFNADGSLDLLVQHTPPVERVESNWLPAPAGDFNLILRMYWPRAVALDRTWVPPPLRRVD